MVAFINYIYCILHHATRFNSIEGKFLKDNSSRINSCIFKQFIIIAGARIPASLPIRLVAAVWCLVSVVLLNAYTSILTSYLMAPRFHAMVDSIEDVAEISRPTFMVLKYTSFESDIFVCPIYFVLKEEFAVDFKMRYYYRGRNLEQRWQRLQNQLQRYDLDYSNRYLSLRII